tara:strand:- start:169 stop:420 length:252 start_codon:yes stop_codon:yes gene_type:complete
MFGKNTVCGKKVKGAEMYHINKKDIPTQVSLPRLIEYRDSLKTALASPTLNAKQRTELRKKLKSAGEPRNYAKQKPLAGAVKN